MTNLYKAAVTAMVVCIGFPASADFNAEDLAKESTKNSWWEFSEAPGFDLEASGKDKKGSVGIGVNAGRWYINPYLSGRINDAGQGSFIDRSGLAVDSELGIHITRFMYDPKKMKDENVMLESGITLEQHRLRVQEAQDRLNECEAGVHAQSKENACDSEKKALAELMKGIQVDHKHSPLETYRFFTLSGKATNTKFKHFDTASNETVSGNEDGYSLGLAYGQVKPQIGFRWEIGLNYQEGYAFASNNPEKNICSPIAETDLTECRDIRLAPANKTTRITPSAAVSFQYPADRIIKGLQLKVSYIDDEAEMPDNTKTSDSKWVLEAPVYFFSNKNNQFNGGVKLSWLSDVAPDSDKLAITVFFSKPLDIFQ